jgi:predicted DNA-binding ribbon-helix-helix protein
MQTSYRRNRTRTVPKRSVVINGRNSSVSIEDEFWNELVAVANTRGMSVGDMISEIDRQKRTANLSSAMRTFVLRQYYNFDESD